MNTSIIIVTRDRAGHLKEALDSLRGVAVPDGMETELLIVDNASTDETAEVVRSFRLDGIRVRHACEDLPGLSRGRNRGIAESSGGILVFTDDDVRFPADWLVRMTAPIATGRALAVSGGIGIAPHLLRPWMTSTHRAWLVSSECLDQTNPGSMIGANMTFSREVLEKVPMFDVELGAGALGSGEETLFSSQLKAAGFSFHNCLDVRVTHHFDPSRLLRQSWLQSAARFGASRAYVGHHWEHWPCRFGRLKAWRAERQLAAWRAANPGEPDGEGCPEQELELVTNLALIRAHMAESGRPRKYERHGLVKIG